MEYISIGFLLGVIFSMIVAGAGVIYGGTDKRQHDTDNDVRLYFPSRYRTGCGDKRDHAQMVDNESLASILRTIAATGIDKHEADYLIEAANRLEV